MSDIRFSTFPRTLPPPAFIHEVVDVFRAREDAIGTVALEKGLTSDNVLGALRADLESVGFMVEAGKATGDKIFRPIFFGENGDPTLQYEIDAYHSGWECGLEVEAGRAWMGNAIYRDLIQALVMVQVRFLVLAVPNAYKYMSAGKQMVSRDYDNAVAVADALYGHSRMRLPYDLVVIGY